MFSRSISSIAGAAILASYAGTAFAQPVNGDLQVNSMTLSPTTVASGGSVLVQWTVDSVGIAGGRGQVTSWEIRREGSVVDSASPLTIIPNGGTATFSRTISMPTVTTDTAVQVVVRVFGDSAFTQANNSLTRFVTVLAPPRPNLACFTPNGWSGSVVVSNAQNATVSQGLLVPDFPAFISYVVGNFGGATPAGIPMAVRVDGSLIASPTPLPPLGANAATAITNIVLPSAFLTPGSHTVEVRIDSDGLVQESNENDNLCSVTFTVSPPPANDRCADATTVALGATSFDTTFARTDGPVETICLAFNDNNVSKDVWFRYTPSGRGQLTVETCGTGWDTKLAAYPACPTGTGSALACDDDAVNPPCTVGASASRIRINTTGGQPILLRVGGYRNSQTGVTAFGSGLLTLSFLATPCTASDIAGANQSAGSDGALTSDDIIVFLGWFFAGDNRADVSGVNQSIGADGQLTADDIIVFLSRYFAGC